MSTIEKTPVREAAMPNDEFCQSVATTWQQDVSPQLPEDTRQIADGLFAGLLHRVQAITSKQGQNRSY